ncbi:Inhibitor of sigma-G Gin [Proteiniborus ethanoligenes]|uniref:Inhibitor of sigma-G Gin n=1 Tax=Proteiniborus ethanoligenes TaxID=415015 RepID=A0A1H3PFN8_9FIRM|nr:sigma factor G inhibitor Gin [Proteiniborus ethanoligenes]SDY99189.1 Inhibitor of sigma-G Gin [Proteiniborus ethanoligenes]
MNPNICQICNGIEKDGINLLGAHLCTNCLNRISKTDIDDIEYEYYKSIIKKTWLNYIIEYS